MRGAKTREQAIQILKNECQWHWYTHDYEKDIRGLRALIKISSVGMIEMNEETAAKLKPFMEVQK